MEQQINVLMLIVATSTYAASPARNCDFQPANKSKLTPLPPQTSTTMALFSSPCNSCSNFERSLDRNLRACVAKEAARAAISSAVAAPGQARADSSALMAPPSPPPRQQGGPEQPFRALGRHRGKRGQPFRVLWWHRGMLEQPFRALWQHWGRFKQRGRSCWSSETLAGVVFSRKPEVVRLWSR